MRLRFRVADGKQESRNEVSDGASSGKAAQNGKNYKVEQKALAEPAKSRQDSASAGQRLWGQLVVYIIRYLTTHRDKERFVLMWRGGGRPSAVRVRARQPHGTVAMFHSSTAAYR
ncbi:hypothetical protein EVAR_7941_1 [Eumeta japonica]|uniref:Uncharacterized protein n=1 Tax=Eumeta variegata TaxID=151549 RepID=A0A4C1TGU0_EUMVA|nr:hypothetical protein EVAR_7941_1 [Eumeta japonica]